jgi:hypothetical protein
MLLVLPRHATPAIRKPPPPLDLADMLGAAWDDLPPSLRRRFAPGHGPARYAGTMRFERNCFGAVFAWLVKPLGAPLPVARAADTPVEVRVQARGAGVVWARYFGAQGVVRSVKTAGPDGSVLERTDGGLGMVLRVTVEAGALVFTSQRFFLAVGRWRLKLPGWLTPGQCRVEHRAIDATRFVYALTMRSALWGETFRQIGIFSDDMGDVA